MSFPLKKQILLLSYFFLPKERTILLLKNINRPFFIYLFLFFCFPTLPFHQEGGKAGKCISSSTVGIPGKVKKLRPGHSGPLNAETELSQQGQGKGQSRAATRGRSQTRGRAGGGGESSEAREKLGESEEGKLDVEENPHSYSRGAPFLCHTYVPLISLVPRGGPGTNQ